MSKLPKLKIKLPFPRAVEDICDIEQARYRLDYRHELFLIVAEDRLICSYEELVQLAEQDCFRNREFLEVQLQPIIVGG